MKITPSTLLLWALTVIFVLFLVGIGLLCFLIKVDAAPLCQVESPTQNCPPPMPPPAEPTPSSPPPEETATGTPAPPEYTLTPLSSPEPSVTITPGANTPTPTETKTQPVLVPPDEDSPPTGRKHPTPTPTIAVTALPQTGGAEEVNRVKTFVTVIFAAILLGFAVIILHMIRRVRDGQYDNS